MNNLLAGVTGMPVEQSLSPLIHGVFMKEAGITGSYLLFPVEAEGFPLLLGRLLEEGYSGINVTVPHKRLAAEMCSSLSHQAKLAGAVNTLVFKSGLTFGHNTDVSGFKRMARELPEPFFVMGMGGAASAVSIALEGREHRLLCREEKLPLNLPPEGTLVNATPIGWRNEDSFPLTPRAGWCFADLNYNPGWKWRNRLSETGVRVVTGEVMLVEQAGCSFSLWTGYTPDERAKNRALAELKARING